MAEFRAPSVEQAVGRTSALMTTAVSSMVRKLVLGKESRYCRRGLRAQNGSRDIRFRIPAGRALEGPDTDTLTGEYRRNHAGTGVQMSAKSLQRHGKLWAEKVEVWLDGMQ